MNTLDDDQDKAYTGVQLPSIESSLMNGSDLHTKMFLQMELQNIRKWTEAPRWV